MTRKMISLTVLVLAGASAVTSAVVARGEDPDGLSVAQAYIAGMESGDLGALTALFRADGRSSILENASDEGSWEHYRDHHLKPEMEAAGDFKFTIAEESEERFGDAILVQQTGSFEIEVGGELRTYRVAVSYVIVTEEDELRIAHVHWSSRAK